MSDKKAEIQDYLSKNINIFIEPLVYEIVKKRPSDPLAYAQQWLAKKMTEKKETESFDSESDDDIEEIPFDE